MNVLVTGGAGYAGSMLVPMLLAARHRVRVLDSLRYGGRPLLGVWAHPQFEFVNGDVRDGKAVAAALRGMDAVVHLAAIVGDPACKAQPELAREVNFDATLLLVAAAQKANVQRFVFASTCSNYGRMADPTEYLDENSPLRPVSLYAETKVAAEGALLDSSGQSFISTVLRFATLFGTSPRMRFDLTVNEFTMEMVSRGRLVVFGEQFWRPYIHVRDAARAIQMVIESEGRKVAGRVFNAGSTDENYQKKQIVALIRTYAPDAIVEYVQRAEDPRDYRVSFERIRKELGFEVERTVPAGIAEVASLVRSGVIAGFDAPEYRN